jgi:hypothetical protein
MSNDRKTEWIPVTERLPEDDVRVLAYDGLKTFTAELFEGLWHWIEGDTFGMDVTHWRPLPAPPTDSK